MTTPSKLFLLTALTMVAFAANSLLTRFALLADHIGPGAFGLIRVFSGAVMLLLLVAWNERRLPKPAAPAIVAVLALSAYIVGFSYAYVSMDAGIGALILFGGVQITMFLGALIEGERPSLFRWGGMVLAMAGLGVLTLPSGPVSFNGTSLALMCLAAVGWGVYSLFGRRSDTPLTMTCWNFVYSLPIVVVVALIWQDAEVIDANGIGLAIASGAVTSALGYALWYALLPQLGATRAALSQLSVPVIALVLGAAMLAEPVSGTTTFAAMLILVGIAVGFIPTKTAGE